jgi:hypothetical protein
MRTCTKPDRDEPRLVCGYPLPCPHHTVVLEHQPEVEHSSVADRERQPGNRGGVDLVEVLPDQPCTRPPCPPPNTPPLGHLIRWEVWCGRNDEMRGTVFGADWSQAWTRAVEIFGDGEVNLVKPHPECCNRLGFGCCEEHCPRDLRVAGEVLPDLPKLPAGTRNAVRPRADDHSLWQRREDGTDVELVPRIAKGLSDLGSEHEPPAGWQHRVAGADCTPDARLAVVDAAIANGHPPDPGCIVCWRLATTTCEACGIFVCEDHKVASPEHTHPGPRGRGDSRDREMVAWTPTPQTREIRQTAIEMVALAREGALPDATTVARIAGKGAREWLAGLRPIRGPEQPIRVSGGTGSSRDDQLRADVAEAQRLMGIYNVEALARGFSAARGAARHLTGVDAAVVINRFAHTLVGLFDRQRAREGALDDDAIAAGELADYGSTRAMAKGFAQRPHLARHLSGVDAARVIDRLAELAVSLLDAALDESRRKPQYARRDPISRQLLCWCCSVLVGETATECSWCHAPLLPQSQPRLPSDDVAK